jgi:hypothetical protein
VALQPCRDTRNGSRRYDKHAPAGSEYRHADRPAGWVDDETAFGAPPQAQINLDPSVDLAATQGAPGASRAGHHAERGGRRTIFGTHRYGERADGDGCRLKRNRPQVGTVNPQQSDIGGGIASDELSRHRVAAGKCDGVFAFLGQGFIGCDDEPSIASGDAGWTNPISGIAGCCARAASGHAAAPPSSVMISRRFH